MKKVKKNDAISQLNQNGTPIITIYDVLAGTIIMAIIIFTIILGMQWMEGDSKWIQKETNVREESIQQLHPHIP